MRRRRALGTLVSLVLVFFLTILGFAGILFTILAIGGLGEWTTWQFVGVFGLIESGAGLSNLFLPNIWRLPVVQLEAAPGRPVTLAASTLTIPHWGGLARFAAGMGFVLLAGWQTSLGTGSIVCLPAVALFGAFLFGFTSLIARAGTAWPQIDVLQISITWNRQENKLPPISMGASIVQLTLSILPLPVIRAFAPSAFYRPELAPSAALIGSLAVAAALSLVAAAAVWAGRIQWRASRWQQTEAERNA